MPVAQRRFRAPRLLSLAALIAPLAMAQTAVRIDLSKPGIPVSPTFYGLMTEEINYSYDGGLYAELVRNRAFKDDDKAPVHWSVVQDAGGTAAIALDQRFPVPATALTTSLRLDAARAARGHRVGIANAGYWGIPVKPNTRYRASFYARTAGAGGVPLTVSIEGTDGNTVYAQAEGGRINGDWKRYSVTLTTAANVKPTAAARLVIATESPGTVWFNQVSLFPPTYNDRPNGNRVDLMQKLVDMKPRFLRFPGGNYLEGVTVDTRFKWKETLGPIAQRPGHPGTWGYRSSDGMGLLEFLEWCEDMKAEPVLAVYAGYSLRGENIPAGPGLQPFVQEALDEIEYVTGDVSTKWGAQRATDGHPAPFKLRYVEIGNEDNFDHQRTYDGRYAQFYKAVKAKYPNMQIIATMPVNGMKPDIIDDHYYKREQGMFEEARHYDQTDRNGPKIFVGEWATREGSPTPNFGAALGDAAFMTGMERNSDVVIMSAYAPLFVNVNPGGMQWTSDLIGYDALNSYGSPSYYAQVMFSSCLGDHTVTSSLSDAGGKFFYSATAAPGKLCLKLVNASSAPQTLNIALNGAGAGTHAVQVQTMKANTPWATNTIMQPERIVPVKSTTKIKGERVQHSMPAYTIEVMQIELK